MLSHLKSALISVSLGLILVGCQSGGNQIPASQTAINGVRCEKCQVSWVQGKSAVMGTNGNIIGYTAHPEMTCASCKDAAANYFDSARLEHTCPACGGDMQKMHEAHYVPPS